MGRKTKYGVGVMVALVIVGALTSDDEEAAAPTTNDTAKVDVIKTVTPTPMPTSTDTEKAAMSTVTAQSTMHPTVTLTEPPSATAATTTQLPATQSTEIAITPERATYYATTGANVRPCPQLSCIPLGQIAGDDEVIVTGITVGEVVAGDSRWFRTTFNGHVAYIHRSVLSKSAIKSPIASPMAQEVPSDNESDTSGSQYTEPVTEPTDFVCPRNCTQAVEMGLTARQAAQCPHLDRDGDGVACYGD